MKKIACIALILLSTNLFGQDLVRKDNFSREITKVKGDLNNDKIADLVVVTQDTVSDKAPYRLQVFFGQPDGKYKLVVSTTKAIDPQFPGGKNGFSTGNSFSGITIKKGVMIINNDLLRGNFEHTCRFQNGNFEVIGFSEVYSDGQGTMTTIEFDLSTGIRTERSERYDNNRIVSNKKTKIIIRPLPKLQDLEPFKKDLY